MTEPQPVMAQPEQDQLTRQVGRSLLTVAGEGWQRVRAEYRAAGRHIEADVFVTGPDGTERPVRPPQDVVAGLGRLRQGMYRPGRGTWFSALYELAPPSTFSAEFEPDVEPRWRRVPPPIGFADELRFFPRADEHIPDWLRQRAGLPPAEQQNEGEQNAGAPSPQAGQPGPGVPINAPGAQPAPAPLGGPPTPPPGTPAQHGHQQTPPRGVPANPYQGPAQQGGQHAPGFGGQPTPAPGFNRPPVPAQPPGYQPQPAPTPPHGTPRSQNASAEPAEEPWFEAPIDPPPPLHARATGAPYQQRQD